MRDINQKLHILVFPFHFISWFMILNLSAYVINSSSLNFDKFTVLSISTMMMSALGSLFGIIFWSLAFKYAESSQIAPLASIQNVLIFLAEYISKSCLTLSQYSSGLPLLSPRYLWNSHIAICI